LQRVAAGGDRSDARGCAKERIAALTVPGSLAGQFAIAPSSAPPVDEIKKFPLSVSPVTSGAEVMVLPLAVRLRLVAVWGFYVVIFSTPPLIDAL
jgi:hypothetical protein